ncbi:thymidylate synthase, flavin-dependent [Paenibacillus polymyxa SQR-21]|uniref:FAD-dependent thymidylate synthase n=1 Tax=Paenibacillus polymyxa TaxID=1406 RepID=UPI00042F5A7D|nr:FAD-dependent thymidylate synthase [Paenibacillus polymyxa]AHM66891.1 thymidylate synthase, flavin-dependent [Paenibacillus polymyxa SQR-21]
MGVKLIAHTQLSDEFYESFDIYGAFAEYEGNGLDRLDASDGQVVALTAIRTCYSPLKPTEIIPQEGAKYFDNAASDGAGGTEADRLFRHITRSGHTSTLEHITYTFAIEGVSRALLAQLTRHRHLSFSVQSQRYVRMGSGNKIGGFDYVTPPSADDRDVPNTNRYDDAPLAFRESPLKAYEVYDEFMDTAQRTYDALRAAGVPAEDARMVLPNAASCNLVMTGNLRTLLDFYAKRRPGNGAQWEIAELAVSIRDEIVKVDPWLAPYFKAK